MHKNQELNQKNTFESKLKRIDRNYISSEIRSVFNLEKGLFFTVKSLLINPGKSVREFLFEDRKKYVKPIVYLLIAAILFSFIIKTLNLNVSFFNVNNIKGLRDFIRGREVGDWTQRNLGYSQLVMGLFIGVWLQVFFKKANYNFYEILVMLSFVLGEAFILLGVFLLLAALFKSQIIGVIGSLVYFTYIIWAVSQFFGGKNVKNFIKSFLAYFLGNITYLLVLVIIAFLLKLVL